VKQMHNLFYIPPGKISGKEITINGDTFHHLKNVLRKKTGATVVFTDGAGSMYTTKIVAIARARMTAHIVAKNVVERQRRLRCDLAFVPVKGARNDYILEKGTELGVTCFFPFVSACSVVQTISRSRLQRFKRVALSAMLQSQQSYIPAIQPRADVSALTAIFPQYDCVFVAHPDGHSAIDCSASLILFIVGPEGGFDAHEVSRMTNMGARLLSLGAHRLRSETAAVVGMAKIMSALGVL
jgi:16S rRNA (uracil1498-N3)-methyltransferase